MTEQNTDFRISTEEKSMYRMLVWFLIWPPLFFVARRLVPEVVAIGVTAFIFVPGTWFVDPAKQQKIGMARWIALSIAAALTIALIASAIAS